MKRRPRLFTAIDAIAVSTFALMVAALIDHLITSAEDRDATACALAAAAGWVVADFASGLVHWFADSFFGEDTRWIGPLLIQPFREHHRDPLAMTHHGFLELSGNTCLALIPFLGTALALPLAPALQAAVLALVLGLFATNLFHRWAHDPAPPPLVRWLQNHWLILPPAHHFRHHAPGHGAAYCVTTGWTNPLADACGVFPALRRLLVGLAVPTADQTSGVSAPAVLGDRSREL